MKEFLQKHWRRGLLMLFCLPFVIAGAIKWPLLIVGLATIPIEDWISTKIQIPPAISRLFGLILFVGLMTIGWYFMEAIVVLAAFALAADTIFLCGKIADRIQQEKLQAAVV